MVCFQGQKLQYWAPCRQICQRNCRGQSERCGLEHYEHRRSYRGLVAAAGNRIAIEGGKILRFAKEEVMVCFEGRLLTQRDSRRFDSSVFREAAGLRTKKRVLPSRAPRILIGGGGGGLMLRFAKRDISSLKCSFGFKRRATTTETASAKPVVGTARVTLSDNKNLIGRRNASRKARHFAVSKVRFSSYE